VDEIVLPVDAKGRYAHEPGRAYGPEEPVWRSTAPRKSGFFASFMSGSQRLPNGNTLICHGVSGTIPEVAPNQEWVWEYICHPTEPMPSDMGIAPGRSPVFRAYRYGLDYPGLAGKDLRARE
jgi:hypothetical protein